MGFWGWSRHGDVVVMSAELGLSAWDVRGAKLWETFVEPPWRFDVVGSDLELDVMGQRRTFSLERGPRAP